MFVCQECGYETPKFLGRCPECGLWNTLKEFKVQSSKFKGASAGSLSPKPEPLQLISNVSYQKKDRISTGISEMDTVLGGGIVAGSVTLLAGDPGIGKSTLLLQVALNLSLKDNILYISGEESESQVKLRAERLSKNLKNNKLFIVSLTDPDNIISILEENKPSFVIIDSIQTMASENLEGLSGSVGQVRYAATQFIRAAKTLNIPVILVGHVTKEGMVAGPMVLSHMVDTVLFLEGEKNTGTRILRGLKNRFGPVDEVGIFLMQEDGMTEVTNPESLFLNKANTEAGSVLTVTLEGTRAFLVEIQALVIFSKLPFPKRVASGVDYKRLELILAILQKHAKLPTDTLDVFVNVAGGFKLSDPAGDLGIALAILSSLKNLSLSKAVAIAELGLLGELRMPSLLDKRIKEAKKLGFTKVITPKNYKNVREIVSKIEYSYK
ncbi:MAG: DNA repair protein RadA [Candidatus Levybacteria bacterium RBG_13_35_9]|nr:MAG: DNA repair protein RadA [Candidatus Levybacteria bacterium RBG_13_35_9]